MALVTDLMQGWRDNFTVRRVFGDVVEKDNVTIIPVAMVAGGGGGGDSHFASPPRCSDAPLEGSAISGDVRRE